MDRRVLFVDDESKLLEGLRRLLRSMRHEWDMHFVSSAAEALDLMSRLGFDIAVTDMRMPGMNGLDFLTEVRLRHPEVIRVILSGQSDGELTERSIGIAHQYISKPCEPETIIATIQRARSLKSLLCNEKLRALVSQIESVPSLPTIYSQIVDEIHSTEPSIRRIGDILATDPGMTAKILQLVNSAFFGLSRRIGNTVDATAYLGIETIQSLVLSTHAFAQFHSPGIPRLSVELLWNHSMRTAASARRIARAVRAPLETAKEAFTAGLLHDVGMLVLLHTLPERYADVIARAKAEDLSTVETEVFGATHAEVGAYLLGIWALPDALADAAAFHHKPQEGPGGEFCALTAVHVADSVELDPQSPELVCGARLDRDYVAALSLPGLPQAWEDERIAVLEVGQKS